MAERSPLRRWLRRTVRHRVDGALARLGFALFGALSIDRASAVGGWIGRTLGPRLPASRRAERQLRRVFPERDAAEIARLVRGMWDNLGRVAAEYPHLHALRLYDGDGRVEVIGAEHVDRLREDGQGGVFFSAHLGNWEIASLGATQRGVPLTHVYRAVSNPRIEALVMRARGAVAGRHWAKGPGTARELVAALKSGAHLGMLADQKLNEGIPVPFFGREAMTAPVIAQLALRYRCPVVPARVERVGGARFRLTIYPPLSYAPTGAREADILALMTRVNALFEAWIRARPEQWLWLHRRWPD